MRSYEGRISPGPGAGGPTVPEQLDRTLEHPARLAAVQAQGRLRLGAEHGRPEALHLGIIPSLGFLHLVPGGEGTVQLMGVLLQADGLGAHLGVEANVEEEPGKQSPQEVLEDPERQGVQPVDLQGGGNGAQALHEDGGGSCAARVD